MARRLPRRGPGGRFVKGGGRRRSASSRRSPRRRKKSRRRSYRSNPTIRTPRLTARSIMKQTVQGVQDAAWVVGGKAVARALPTMFNLPKEGAVGLGVQLGTAIAAGWLAHTFTGRDAGRFALAGGLSAPLETAIVAYRVPFLAPALSPATAAAQVGAYRWPSMSGYVLPRSQPVQMEGFGAYVAPNGAGPLNGDY